MKKICTYIVMVLGLLVCLFGFSVLGASAASVQTVTKTNLAAVVTRYRQLNPSAEQHTITAQHKVVYDKGAHFNDIINGTSEVYTYYSKKGSNLIVSKLQERGFSVAQESSDAVAAAGFEIQVGLLDRAEQKDYLTLFDVNEYAIVVTQDRIMLLAWSDAALELCVGSFLNYLSSGMTSMPVGFIGVGAEEDDEYKTDFPRPEGENIALSAGQYVNDESLEFLYTGSGVSHDAYLAYCRRLESAGFSLLWENVIGNNEFRMYRHIGKEMALYVAYNDFTYKAEMDVLYQANYGTYDDAFAPTLEKCIRIISSPFSRISLPTLINSQQPYTRVTDTYMTTVGIASSQVGTCYVIMLEDGRFVIIDGGRQASTEADAIWNTMLKLYQKAYGSSAQPSSQRPIHVAAWYLTHAHDDHYSAFYKMAELIANDRTKKSAFVIDYVIANIPSTSALMRENSTTTLGLENNKKIYALQNQIGNFQYLKVHTGQRIYLANLMIEVLMTFEDHLPNRILNTNDACVVTRFHFKSSGAAKNSLVTSLSGDAVTVMFLGDSWRPSSRYLCAMYGEYLKSDISQIAHHGNIGCEQELYALIAPTGVLFSNDKSSFKDYCWGTTYSSNPEKKNAYAVDKYVVRGVTMNGHTLTSVRYIWAAVSGTYTTLRFTTSGVQYESAFDLMKGTTLSYVDVSKVNWYQSGFAKHVHQSSTTLMGDATGHWNPCACGEKMNFTAHVDNNADCKCDVCAQTGDSLHRFAAAETYNDTQHKRICPCGEVQYVDHAWNDGEVIEPATHMTEGTRRLICTECGSMTEEAIAKLTAHEYGDWQAHSDTEHKHVCVCGDIAYAPHSFVDGEILQQPTHLEEGTKTLNCTDCGAQTQASLPKLTEHTYGAWEPYNDTQHKRTCACDAVEYAEHVWDEGSVTKQPTHLEEGTKTFYCIDCGEQTQESLPKLTEHTYGAWEMHNVILHKRTCACGVLEYAEHVKDEGSVTKQPTHLEEGTKTFYCADCAGETRESLPKLTEHTYGAWEAHNATQHKRTCACGAAEYAEHMKDEGSVTKQPTQTEPGIKTVRCTVCGDAEEISIPVLEATDEPQSTPTDTGSGDHEEGGATVLIVSISCGVTLLGVGGALAWLIVRRKRKH